MNTHENSIDTQQKSEYEILQKKHTEKYGLILIAQCENLISIRRELTDT